MDSKEIAKLAIAALEDKKAEDIKVIDISLQNPALHSFQKAMPDSVMSYNIKRFTFGQKGGKIDSMTMETYEYYRKTSDSGLQ